MHAPAIEATPSHSDTAHHLLRKGILIVSVFIGMLGMNTAQAVGEVSKYNYDYAAAELSCKRYDNQGTYYFEAYTLHPTGLVIAIPYGPASYVNQCQANICKWTRQGTVEYSWLTPHVCTFIPSTGNPPSQRVCPLNARLATQAAWGWYPPATFANTPCVCEAGFVPDQAATACVQCLAPQRIDTVTGRCITDTYEIKLTGDTQTEPSQSLNFTATVINTITQHPPTIPVTIKVRLSVEDKSGGHDHGTDTRPRGSLNSTACATDDTCLESPADGNGALNFTFKAEPVSGIHTITASCDKCSGEDSKTVEVKVEGLEQIPDSIIKYAQFDSNGEIGAVLNTHEKNHYLTADSILKLNKLVEVYAEVNPGFRLCLNDGSLEWGGLFDVGTTPWKKPHKAHRRGTSLDIRAASAAGKKGEVPASKFLDFIKKAAKNDLTIGLHCLNSSDTDYCLGQPNNRHFHVDF